MSRTGSPHNLSIRAIVEDSSGVVRGATSQGAYAPVIGSDSVTPPRVSTPSI
jgi:hypothetical protein